VHELSSRRGRRLSAGAGKITLALGLCLCAGQLVAGPAAAAPAVVTTATTTVNPVTTAAPATTAAPVRSKVSAKPNRRTIGWGSAVRVTAKVTNSRDGKAVAGGTVRLQAWRNGAWRTWQTRRVATSGQVVFTAKPQVTGSFRTVFSGTKGFQGAKSASVRVTVKATGAKVLTEARRHSGRPYRYGAAGPRAFDCSGYTQYVFRKAAGKKLPHNADAQQRHGRAVGRSAAKPGDLIIFRSGSYGYHAAIYAGNGYMYDAPQPGQKVGKHKIWSRNYVVRRLV
jgi:cell wall-associated NlpC family hydrolase